MRLNVGCGFDYREGFVNIDGSAELPRVDRVIDVSRERLTEHFEPGSVELVVAQDFVEHHFHWVAVELLGDFFALLRPGGGVEVRVPDLGYLLSPLRALRPRGLRSAEARIPWIYGGQDRDMGKGDLASRRRHPEFFCHRYGYTRKTMKAELEGAGFGDVRTRREGTNLVATARKP